MSPGRRIQHYRMLRGMTQKALGIAAGFPPATADIRIAQYESGARTPKHALLCTLAEALGVSPSALDIPHIKIHEVLTQLLLALENECGLMITIAENDERSICNIFEKKRSTDFHRDYICRILFLCATGILYLFKPTFLSAAFCRLLCEA